MKPFIVFAQRGRVLLKMVGCVALLFSSTGCFTGGSSNRQDASVVQFLYPGGQAKPVQPHVPALHLPLKVGIAFVPTTEKKHGYYARDLILTSTQERQLLDQVAERFRGYRFVDQIEVIPSAYLRQNGSFENLDQLRGMFGVDVIALVSYDQVQFHDQDAVSLAYWTLVGAYVVPGEKFDTHTMLDTAVYDIESRTLLFRAPGTSRVKGRATGINASEEKRKDALEGFTSASTNMISNLHTELALFQEKVKSRTNDFRIVAKPGYTGGGNFGALEAGMITMAGLIAAWTRARHPRKIEL